MIKKKAYFFAAAMLAALTVTAQETIQREVNVTRAYEPSVSDFLKQRVDPDMTDTTQLHPDYIYEVTPRPLSYGLEMSPIGPLSINTVDNRQLLPFYLKAGAGFPLQSALLFSYAKQLSPVSNVGVVVNHSGQYDKIKNDEGVKTPASHTFNSLRLFGNRRFGRDFNVGGDLSYDFNRISRYGYFNYGTPLPVETDTTGKGLSQFFHIVKGRVKVGNSFTDMSRLNWGLTVDGAYQADRFKCDLYSLKGRLDIGIMVGPGVILGKADFSAIRGLNGMDGYKGDFFIAGLSYNYADKEGFKISIGADVSRDITGEITHFLPNVSIEKSLLDGMIIPFLELQSYQYSNNYMAQVAHNPYVMQGEAAPRSYIYDGRAGLKGTLFNALKYKLYGGYGKIYNIFSYVNHYDLRYAGNVFTTISDTATVWRVGAELELNILNAVDLYGSMEYHSYDMDNYSYVGGMPDFEAMIGARYNYRKKFYVNVDAAIYGERFFYEFYQQLQPVKADSMIDVSLGMDYLINKQVGVFLSVNNLLNQDLYRFNRYPLLGINGTVGVKLSF